MKLYFIIMWCSVPLTWTRLQHNIRDRCKLDRVSEPTMTVSNKHHSTHRPRTMDKVPSNNVSFQQ